MKKNIVNVLLGAAVLTLFAGCNKEQVAGIETIGTSVVRATIESTATKTTLERSTVGGKIAWVKDESIKINGQVYKCTPDVQNPTVAEFTLDANGLVPVPDDNGKFVAVYPYNLKNDSGELVLDGNQLYKQTNMERIFPMYSESNTLDKFEFKNILGLLEITLKGETEITNIIISDEKLGLSGAFTVAADGSAVLKDPTSKTTVNLICNNAKLTPEGTTFYVGVPAANYSKLKVAVISKEGILWSVQAVKGATIERNKIYHLDFTPAFGSSVHECVQLWENGPYWATTNIGAANPTDGGMFFSWANTTGYIWDGTSYVGTSVIPFGPDQYQYSFGSTFDTGENFSGNPSYDAATAIWGEGWRTPTYEEAQKLYALDRTFDDGGTTGNYSDDVLYFSSELNDTDYIAFGVKDGFNNNGKPHTINGWSGCWTSQGANGTKAQVMLMGNTALTKQQISCGFNIRPVRDTPLK